MIPPSTSIAAIDFETASERADSAVAVGVVILSGPRPLRAFYALLAPARASDRNYSIHGIARSAQECAPSFASAWAMIGPALGERPIFLAHNAAFDRRILGAMLHSAGMPAIRARFWCTLAASRVRWPGQPCDLAAVAQRLGIAMDRPHHALFDALLVASVAQKMKTSPVAMPESL